MLHYTKLLYITGNLWDDGGVSTYTECTAYDLPYSWKRLPRLWGHSLHTLCARTASFPPRLVHYFISRYTSPGARILDPYSGKGTTVLQACLTGRKGIGNDVCPDAYVLTAAKARPPKRAALLRYMKEVKRRMEECSEPELENERIRIYYSKKTLDQILVLRRITKEDETAAREKNNVSSLTSAIFTRAMLLGILHGSTSFSLSLPMPHSFSMSPNYVKKKVSEDPKRFRRPDRDVIACLKKKISLVYKDPVPVGFCTGEFYQCDAKELKLSEPVDLIVTSPPYLDAHTYAWDNWIRLWFLEHDYRRVRKRLLQTGSERLYLEEMRSCFRNLHDMLREDSRCFVVVGDVKGHRPLAYILADMIDDSKNLDFTIHRIIVDKVKANNKYPYGRNSNYGIGTDRILELHKGNPPNVDRRIDWYLY